MKNELNFLPESQALKKRPCLLLPLAEAKKIITFAKKRGGEEINGIGLIQKKGNNLLVKEAFILKQNSGPGRAKIDPMALNEYVGGCDDPGEIRFQWHSHGDISGDFFSGKDKDDTIAKWTGEYLVSLVLNNRGQFAARLDIFEPVYLGFEMPVRIIIPVEDEIIRYCEQEIKDKVVDSYGFAEKIERRIEKIFGGKKDESWSQEDDPATIPFEMMGTEEGENEDE